MNIFFLDKDPVKAAKSLCTIHINSQIKESAQMLSTVLHQRIPDESVGLYNPTHAHHPCVFWLTESDANMRWLISHAIAMGDLYAVYRRKEHACYAVLEKIDEIFSRLERKDEILQPPYLAMPEHLQKKYGVAVRQHKKSIQYAALTFEEGVLAYREYYCEKRFKFPEGDARNTFQWYCGQPSWYK